MGNESYCISGETGNFEVGGGGEGGGRVYEVSPSGGNTRDNKIGGQNIDGKRFVINHNGEERRSVMRAHSVIYRGNYHT